MNLELIDGAVESEEAGSSLLQALDQQITVWMSDQTIDETELAEMLAALAELGRVIESKLEEHQGKGEGMLKIFPGSPFVVISWLLLANLILMDGIKLRPLRISDESRQIASTRANKFVLRELAAFSELSSYTTAKSLSFLLLFGFIHELEEADELVSVIQTVNPAFGNSVNEFAVEMGETYSELVAHNSMPSLAEYFAELEQSIPKVYAKHYRVIPSTYEDQKYLANVWAQDHDLNRVHLVFGDSVMSMSNEKKGTQYANQVDVTGISIGSLTHRVHQGFSHTDEHRWTIDIYTKKGSVHQFTVLLGIDNKDTNPKRETLTEAFHAIEGYYPVTSSGRHSVGESGYQTTMTQWF